MKCVIYCRVSTDRQREAGTIITEQIDSVGSLSAENYQAALTTSESAHQLSSISETLQRATSRFVI